MPTLRTGTHAFRPSRVRVLRRSRLHRRHKAAGRRRCGPGSSARAPRWHHAQRQRKSGRTRTEPPIWTAVGSLTEPSASDRKVVMSGYWRRLTGRQTSPGTRGTARWRCSAIQRRPANSSLTVIAARRSTSHPRQGCGPVGAVPEAIASRHVLGRYNGQVGRLSQGHLPLMQIASIGRAL